MLPTCCSDNSGNLKLENILHFQTKKKKIKLKYINSTEEN